MRITTCVPARLSRTIVDAGVTLRVELALEDEDGLAAAPRFKWHDQLEPGHVPDRAIGRQAVDRLEALTASRVVTPNTPSTATQARRKPWTARTSSPRLPRLWFGKPAWRKPRLRASSQSAGERRRRAARDDGGPAARRQGYRSRGPGGSWRRRSGCLRPGGWPVQLRSSRWVGACPATGGTGDLDRERGGLAQGVGVRELGATPPALDPAGQEATTKGIA